MRALLEVTGLSAGYGPLAVLHEVGLSIAPARVTAVLGANGAGKSTLLRTLSGLLPATAGTVRYDGQDLLATPVEDRVRLGVAHVPEGGGVIGDLVVEENLRLGGCWRRGSAGARATAAAIGEVYTVFPVLADRRRQLAHQLSGGERQMLALGRALVARPRLLLLDEPSLGLAPAVTARTMALLRRLRDTTGVAVLLVEQNVRSALAIADDAVLLALGRVVARGRAADLAADDHLRHAYLGF